MKLTTNQTTVLLAYLEAGMNVNGAETVDGVLQDNMTFEDVAGIAKATGLNQKQVKPIIASLNKKALLDVDVEAPNGEGPVQQVLTEKGIRLGFELLADAADEEPAPKADNVTDLKADEEPTVDEKIRNAKIVKMPKAKGPRTLKPHRYCDPVDKPENITAVQQGSKKHKLFDALWDGATLEELMEATGWTRPTVQSSFGVDVKNSGFGAERREDGKYYLLRPKGLKRLPVTEKGMTRADALVAACK